jgi:cardiolipin synthase
VEEVQKPEAAKEPPKIVGSKGELPPHKSEAILEKLNQQAEPTDILKRNIALMEAVSGTPLVAGNKVTLLIDGPATYAAMLAALSGAKDHINFESYIFADDETGRTFADLLIQKQSEGVQVNLIYDSVGCMNVPEAFFKRLRDHGIRTLEFNPINPLKVRRKWLLTERDHRKILIVDGKVAFTGGVNISGVYSEGSSATGREREGALLPWRDTHVQIEGPAVAELQKLFLDTWSRQKGPELPKKNYFPALERKGNTLVHVVGNTSGQDNRATYIMYLSAITHSENSVHLTSSYFVPNQDLAKALTDAAARGVDVKIILPGASDTGSVFYAGRSYYTKLLKSGIKIYEHRKAILHAKTAMIDGVWSTIGSTNLDWWSLLRNDEVNVIILGADFASKMEDMFTKDLEDCNQISLTQWEERPITERMRELLSHFFRYWL